MGHLFLSLKSFELKKVEENKRDEIFRNFCNAVDNATRARDLFYATDNIHIHRYSYGSFYYDFLFQNWDAVNASPHLKGISSTSLNLYHSLVFAIPNLVNSIHSEKYFTARFKNQHFGFSGFRYRNPSKPYVSCYPSWRDWKQVWLSQHQSEIQWHKDDDDFLPCKKISDEILWKEV
jgi:hypothetical protein